MSPLYMNILNNIASTNFYTLLYICCIEETLYSVYLFMYTVIFLASIINKREKILLVIHREKEINKG